MTLKTMRTRRKVTTNMYAELELVWELNHNTNMQILKPIHHTHTHTHTIKISNRKSNLCNPTKTRTSRSSIRCRQISNGHKQISTIKPLIDNTTGTETGTGKEEAFSIVSIKISSQLILVVNIIKAAIMVGLMSLSHHSSITTITRS